MKMKTIGFGYTKNLGNYENCKLYLEAELEDWEDSSESLNLLRNQVAWELNLPDKWHDLKSKFVQQLRTLEATNIALRKAEEKWEIYKNFLTAHGVDPDFLSINSPPVISLKEAAEIAHELDAAQDLLPLNEEAIDDEDSDYFDPYYGDEYDRLYNQVDDDEPENSYF